MSRAITPGELKALVRQLISAVGGVEAAGAILNVSHQRISQLQSVSCDDQMTFLQIAALEVVAERPIVTGAQARAIEGETADLLANAAVEAVTSSAGVLRLVHDMEADGTRDAGEIRKVQSASQANLKEAQELADAAARLTPGKVG